MKSGRWSHHQALDELLTQNGIDHEYVEITGAPHRVPYDPDLEFMSENLSSETDE